jgi:hypothetical protein
MAGVESPRLHCVVSWNSDPGPNFASGTPRVIVEPSRARLAWVQAIPRLSLAYGVPELEVWSRRR